MFSGPEGVRIIPGGSGIRDLADLPSSEFVRLLQGLQDVQPAPDYLIIDTGAGIGSHVTTLAQLADAIVVVVRDEPASLADAYGLIKVAHTELQCQSFHVVVNDVKDPQRGQLVFKRLQDVATRFLGLPLTLVGIVPHDEAITDAMRRRDCVVTAFPDSRVAVAIRRLADQLSNAVIPTDANRFLLDKLARRPGVSMP
ncbi:MAG: MinD/ParA family protein [Nevskiaceae bacterium]